MKALADNELCAIVANDAGLRDAAFTELYQRHSRRVFAYCRHRLGDPSSVDDVFQETFIRFYQRIRAGNAVQNVASYVMSIARNLCFDSQAKRPPIDDSVELAEIAHVEDPVEENDLAELVALALEVLPAEQKEALLLQVYGELSYAEISAELGVPVTTVRNWLVRGKKQLRDILVKRLQEDRR